MAQDIPATPSHIKMTKPNSCNFNSIFLSPSTNAEVCSIIDRLKNKKAQRYTDVETKFIYKNDVHTKEEREAVRSFERSVSFSNNRYVVALPFKENTPELLSNYSQARTRLISC